MRECELCSRRHRICLVDWYVNILQGGFNCAARIAKRFPNDQTYFAKAVKIRYPQYEKLLVLL